VRYSGVLGVSARGEIRTIRPQTLCVPGTIIDASQSLRLLLKQQNHRRIGRLQLNA